MRPQTLHGDDTGLLKIASYSDEGQGKIESVLGKQSRQHGIERLCVMGERDVAISTRGAGIRRWNGEKIEDLVASVGGGKIKSLECYGDRLITCGEEGKAEVRIWPSAELTGAFSLNGKIDCGRLSKDGELLAVGGKNYDLKIWDISRGETVFKARNVPNDSLDIAVPIWITDTAWVDRNALFTCTAYNQIRAYDTRQRRPIKDICLRLHQEEPNKHLNCMVLNDKNDAIVGDNFGKISLVDVYGKGRLLSTFRGPKGSVRSLAVHFESRTLACGGLDRYVRIFDLDSRKQVGKCYAKQVVNAVTLSALPYSKKEEEDDLSGEELDWGSDSEDELEDSDTSNAEENDKREDAEASGKPESHNKKLRKS